MRLRKAGFPARVNSDLRLRFEAKGLTSFAGLELIRRYFKSIDLAGRIRRGFTARSFDVAASR
jgi:hypothetical protein